MSYAIDAHLKTAECLVQSVQTITSSNLDYNDRVSLFVRAINSPLSYKEACELADHIETHGLVTLADETQAFGQIVVAHGDRPEPLRLTFTSRDVFEETLAALRRKNIAVTDKFFGYAITASADEAVKSIEFWSR